jgi:hypothetical protein
LWYTYDYGLGEHETKHTGNKKNFEYILHHTKRLAERDGGILFFDKKKLDELFSYIEQQPEVFGLSMIFEYTKKS